MGIERKATFITAVGPVTLPSGFQENESSALSCPKKASLYITFLQSDLPRSILNFQASAVGFVLPCTWTQIMPVLSPVELPSHPDGGIF